MTTTKNTAPNFRGANEHVARPATAYGCHWCGAFNHAHTLCGCASSRSAHNERPIEKVSIDSITITF